jgi:hypothetical protein
VSTLKKDDRPDCPACGDPLADTCAELLRAGQYHNHDCGSTFSIRKNSSNVYTVTYEGGQS